MIYGCGIDIEEVERFNKHYFDKGKLSDLVYDIFTAREIENFSYFGKEAFLKGFCFKEAFYKAIGSNEFDFKDIEIIFKTESSFKIIKSGLIDKFCKEKGISNIDASVRFNERYAVFKIIIVKE